MSHPDSAWFADISGWRKLSVHGLGAGSWLNDLVSADISPARPGDSVPSLLLSPTGMLRATFSVIRQANATFLLLQDPEQPAFIGDLLAPYVLSSAVDLDDRTADLAAFAVSGASVPQTQVPGSVSRPSCLGSGLDIVADAAVTPELREALAAALPEATAEDVERLRVLAGRPRLGVDAMQDDLPTEAGLDAAVAVEKGCYLGQEAVARTRNLGHPRRLLMHLRAAGPVSPGDAVLRTSDPAGVVTSAASDGSDTVVLARIRWDARDAALRTAGGLDLAPVAR